MMDIQKELRIIGIEKFCKKYKCSFTDYGYKTVISYNLAMTMPHFIHRSVRQTRGIVLHNKTFDLISFGMEKFFNYKETGVPKTLTTLKSSKYTILEKADGTMCCLHYDQFGKYWTISTSGTADGLGSISSHNLSKTFNELFFETWLELNYPNLDELDKNLIYVFELSTPDNLVVVRYDTPQLKLITVRDKCTTEEFTWQETAKIGAKYGFATVKVFDLDVSDFKEIVEIGRNLDATSEGFVVLDEYGSRVKIKGKVYTERHALKQGNDKWSYLDIIKSGDVSEFVTIFPDLQNEIEDLELNYTMFIENMLLWWKMLNDKRIEYRPTYDKKSYWSDCSVDMFSDIVYGVSNLKYASYQQIIHDVWDGKISSESDMLDELHSIPNKKIYNKIK